MSRAFYLLNRRFGPLSRMSEQEIRMSRRTALKAGLAATAGLLLSGPAAGSLPTRRAGKRVVVIGAGFAGLTCAHELSAAGYDVTVVDARARVGGRVLSFNDLAPGRNIEGGAELIGSNHAVWVRYADKFKLTWLDVSGDDDLHAPLYLGGQLLSEDDAAKVWEELEPALGRMNALAEPIDAERPWDSPNAAALDKGSIGGWLKEQDFSPLTRAAVGAQLAGDNGVANDAASWLNMLSNVKGGGLEKYWTDSEVYRCAQGNQALAEKLAAEIGAARIVRELPVTKVEVRGQTVVVTCRDGRTLECDDVVVTAPPSTWGRIAFSPALPGSLAGPTGPQMGINTKYLTVVKRRYWHEAKRSQFALGDGLFSWTWESTDAQDVAEGSAGLTAFSGGPAAERARAIPKDKREAAFASELEILQPGFGEQFVTSRFMDWPSDPWTLAGYSFPRPGQITAIGKALHEGLGRVHFAGEHTSFAFTGYMEGALASGVRTAQKLAARDGVKVGA